MAVPFYDHAKLYRARKNEIDDAIQRVLASGRLDWGDEVPSFEEEFAAWVGASHAVTVGSGTAALKVALLALGIGPGDEVITVPNTDVASSSAIRFTGADVVWVDVDAATRTMDPDAFESAITSRTRAVMPVDLFGHPADLRCNPHDCTPARPRSRRGCMHCARSDARGPQDRDFLGRDLFQLCADEASGCLWQCRSLPFGGRGACGADAKNLGLRTIPLAASDDPCRRHPAGIVSRDGRPQRKARRSAGRYPARKTLRPRRDAGREA